MKPDLKAELLQYSIRYPQEISTTLTMSDFFSQNEERSFLRETLSGHFTASAWIVDATFQYALLTHHRKLNMWVQIGGHADGCDDLRKVALQESLEETGLTNLKLVSNDIFDIDIHAIPERKSEPHHFHYDVRFLIESASREFQRNEESLELRWVHHSEFENFEGNLDDSVKRMHRKWLALIKERETQIPLSAFSARLVQDSSNLS